MHMSKVPIAWVPACSTSGLSCQWKVYKDMDLSVRMSLFRDGNNGGLTLTMPVVIETHILSGSLQGLGRLGLFTAGVDIHKSKTTFNLRTRPVDARSPLGGKAPALRKHEQLGEVSSMARHRPDDTAGLLRWMML